MLTADEVIFCTDLTLMNNVSDLYRK